MPICKCGWKKKQSVVIFVLPEGYLNFWKDMMVERKLDTETFMVELLQEERKAPLIETLNYKAKNVTDRQSTG